MTNRSMRRATYVLVAVGLLAAICVSGTWLGKVHVPGAVPAASAAPAALPPIPTGWPTTFEFGLFNSSSINDMPSSVPWKFRYQYLAGGVNTGSGWATFNNPPGQFAVNFINASQARGMITGFVYYQILQSTPGPDEITNMKNSSTMLAYYNDFKLLMQKIQSAGGQAFIIVEPDLSGTLQQLAGGSDNAAGQTGIAVASSGQPDVAGIPDTVAGYYQALAHIRDLYAPNVWLGKDISTFGPGDDLTISLRNDPNYDLQTHATRVATYLNSLGPGYQFVSFSPLDRDCDFYRITQGSARCWDRNNVGSPNFNQFAQWLSIIVQQTNLRALMWQVPNGNRLFRSENNTDGHYQDDRPEYWLNSTNGRQHIQDWANVGVLGIMFGAGVGSQSHYFDAKGDGITNPSPITVVVPPFGTSFTNSQTASFADDDGGFIRLQTGAYYSAAALPLPGGSAPTPTPTPSSVALCIPRPPIGLTVIPAGPGQLSVTVTANRNAGAPPNLLQSLQFSRLSNATVQIGSQTNVSGTFPVTPAASSQVFTVRRGIAGQAATVEFTVQDNCGSWQTFVGGGPGAFPLGDAPLDTPGPAGSRLVPAPIATTAPVSPTATPPSPTLTATPAPVCNPRPPIAVSTVPGDGGRLDVTVSASGGAHSLLRAMRFGSATNALIDVGDRTGATGGFALTLPDETAQTTFRVRPTTAGQAMTVPLTVVDSCGDWSTFVGSGRSGQ